MNKICFTNLLYMLLVVCLLAACSSQGFPAEGTIHKKYEPRVTIRFYSDGTAELSLNDEVLDDFEYSLQEDIITFTSDRACDRENEEPAAYRWTRKGKELTFEPINEDNCQQRWYEFSQKTWIIEN